MAMLRFLWHLYYFIKLKKKLVRLSQSLLIGHLFILSAAYFTMWQLSIERENEKIFFLQWIMCIFLFIVRSDVISTIHKKRISK